MEEIISRVRWLSIVQETSHTGYETEQQALKESTCQLEQTINDETVKTESIEHFLNLVRARTEITELTPEIVHMFIKRVEVNEAVYTPKKYSHWGRGKTQKIRIIYNYIDDVSESLKDD